MLVLFILLLIGVWLQKVFPVYEDWGLYFLNVCATTPITLLVCEYIVSERRLKEDKGRLFACLKDWRVSDFGENPSFVDMNVF